MRYVLGIDQGASKTHGIVADEQGNVICLVKEAGLCNSSGISALDILELTVKHLLEKTGLQTGDIHALVAGVSGIDWPGDEAAMEEVLRNRLGIADVQAVNDCIVALRAETSSRHAAVICVGSGTNCAVRNGDEQFAYGFYIPDEYQGGMGLGRWAVQAVFDAEMGLLPETKLKEAILDVLQEPTVDDLLRRRSEGRLTTPDYLSLPRSLEKAALEGDEVAMTIWVEYGKILAKYITTRMKRMGMKEEPIQVVLSGSIFKCMVRQFHDTVRDEILAYAPNAVIIPAVYEPIVGAVLMGLERLHSQLPVAVDENLRRSAESYNIRRFEESAG